MTLTSFGGNDRRPQNDDGGPDPAVQRNALAEDIPGGKNADRVSQTLQRVRQTQRQAGQHDKPQSRGQGVKRNPKQDQWREQDRNEISEMDASGLLQADFPSDLPRNKENDIEHKHRVRHFNESPPSSGRGREPVSASQRLGFPAL